jgi:hypothetical protein
LREAVREVAGLDRLLGLLDRQFFNRTRLIRAFNLLNRVLGPCETAARRLRQEGERLHEEAGRVAALLREAGPFRAQVPATYDFLTETSGAVAARQAEVESVHRELEGRMCGVRNDYTQFIRDLEAIRALDEHAELFTDAEHRELFAVLGAHGTSLEERLACYAGPKLDESVAARLRHWVVEGEVVTGVRRRIVNQAVARLDEASDALACPAPGAPSSDSGLRSPRGPAVARVAAADPCAARWTGVAIDLGSARTKAAAFSAETGRAEVVPLGDGAPDLASLVYVTAAGKLLTGEAAVT